MPISKADIGLSRLSCLADILAVAYIEHRQRREPTYCQRFFFHTCGTPACALGHWASANKGRWGGAYVPYLNSRSTRSSLDDAADDFDLTFKESIDLFGFSGCGNARTAKRAAKYIRLFVQEKRRRLVEAYMFAGDRNVNSDR